MDIEIEIPRGFADLEIEIPLAQDRRSLDADNRLSVSDCVIPAAQVNPYMGREVPSYDVLGLDPERVYYLYRDPAALRAGAPKFDGMPLLIEDAPVSAADPKRQLIVGMVRDCVWRDGKILGTLNVWDETGIRRIQSGEQRDLSASYRYMPDMTPGQTPDG